MSIKQPAKIVKCSDTCDDHFYRDRCLTCAPWWDTYYRCPAHNTKLKESGYCSDCKKYYQIDEEQPC
jgi:hypothetical protein